MQLYNYRYALCNTNIFVQVFKTLTIMHIVAMFTKILVCLPCINMQVKQAM